jgi:hypothetical protein
MLPKLELLEKQISRTDQQLIYYLILEQQETNRLLRKLAGEESQEQSDGDIDSMKRQDLMKRMAQLKDKPAGWNKWETEDIRKHLKGVAS